MRELLSLFLQVWIRQRANDGEKKRSAPLSDSSSSEMYNRTPRLVMYKRCMREQRLSSHSHSFFSSLSVETIVDGRTRGFQGLCGAMHTIPWHTCEMQQCITHNATAATADTTGAATSPRRMCAAWCRNAYSDFAHRTRTSGTGCPSCLLRQIATEDIGWLNLYLEKRKEVNIKLSAHACTDRKTNFLLIVI